MNKLVLYLTLTSLSVVLVTFERFSFTTQILLQPYNYLRLHEVIQMTVVILLTVLLPTLIFKEVTHNFDQLKSTKGLILGLIFITGIYFYATGNGVHEVASFLFNNYCDTKNISNDICGSAFFNDYYFGNILYFIGAFLMTLTIIIFEKMKPALKPLSKKGLYLIIFNALIYALAIFAYSGFDRVLVGLIFSITTMLTIDLLLLSSKKHYLQTPFTLFSALAYTIGTLASIIVRLKS